VNPANNPLRAYRCYDGEIYPISPISGEGPAKVDTLQVDAGVIEIDKQMFRLLEDGIYRFYRLPVVSEQRIVCQGGLDSLLKMIGYLWAYGCENRTNRGTNFSQISKRCLVASCTNLALAAKYVLSLFAINSRLVSMVTAKGWGGYDDGHTLLEINSEKGDWFLYDPSFNCCFKGKKGRLSLLDFVEKVHTGEVVLEKLPGNCGHREYATNKYDFGFWVDERMHSTDMLIEWYKRIGDVPLILSGDSYFFPNEAPTAGELAKYKHRYHAISKKKFIETFYPEM
jgi:hypothetical protein